MQPNYGAPQQPYPQYQQPAPAPAPPPQGPPSISSPKGFFSALFDLSFSSFITTKIIKFIFAVWLIVSVLGLLGGLVMGAMRLGDEPIQGILMILASPIAALLYIVIGRIYLELVIVLFRVAENVGEINQKTR
ncbi:MAG: DUF4282 domain-containing protein [Polyangiales bacterium]